MKPFLHSPRSGAHHSARSAALHSAATPPPFIRAAGAPFILCAALCALAPRASAQCAAQSIALKPGWNAVYVEVSPEADAGAIFADWPVDSVGVYDPAAFLATRQFDADGGTDGLVSSPILMWNRDYREASSVSRIPAGVVCLCFNTNLAGGTFRTTLVGVPAAPRTTWHRSEGGEVLNYFGFSMATNDNAAVAPSDYLAGFSDLAGGSLLRIGGKTRGSPPSRLPLYAGDTVSDGAVLLVGSTAVSDWSGALFVSPFDGLDFGTNATVRTLSIRNDGGAPRTVALALRPAVAQLDPRFAFDPALLRWRDADAARTNAAWSPVGAGYAEIARKRLAAGETWRVSFGLDRAAVPATVPRGVPFGALLEARDLDGGTSMKAIVPLRAETSGTGAARNAWPAGLWVADVALDHVGLGNLAETPASGGILRLRLPFHVDAAGTVRLLQRVVLAGETDASGDFSYRLYAGAAEPPATAPQALRISSAVLPTETPVIESAYASFDTEFPYLLFKFDVAADGATSLLRHPFHPQHDGLRWDFSTPAPSGDILDNYKGDVKPETFSVKNSIQLFPRIEDGAERWNPQDAVPGGCIWTFDGLRREGTIYALGDATIRRVSTLADITLE